ncbi:MAG: hypothetical protein IJC99_00160 [Clostridia bacterium]|nr:hypothetical protein [Clostridia bacterium]
MTIDGGLQAEFFLAAFCVGLLAGLFADLLRLLRALLGAAPIPASLASCYERPLPLLGRPLGLPKSAHLLLVRVFDALTELLLPPLVGVLFAVAAFVYHDGVLRPIAFCLLIGGFFLWQRFISRYLTRPLAWLALGVRLLFCYLTALLLLPIRAFWRFLSIVFFKPIGKAYLAICHRVRTARTAAVLSRELAAASRGFDIV